MKGSYYMAGTDILTLPNSVLRPVLEMSQGPKEKESESEESSNNIAPKKEEEGIKTNNRNLRSRHAVSNDKTQASAAIPGKLSNTQSINTPHL